jgi:hypothetical protein
MKYLPHITDCEDTCWHLLEMHFCIDFGGRQIQMEFQREEEGNYITKSATFYYLENSFETEIDVDRSSDETQKMFGIFDAAFGAFAEYDVKED